MATESELQVIQNTGLFNMFLKNEIKKCVQ